LAEDRAAAAASRSRCPPAARLYANGDSGLAGDGDLVAAVELNRDPVDQRFVVRHVDLAASFSAFEPPSTKSPPSIFTPPASAVHEQACCAFDLAGERSLVQYDSGARLAWTANSSTGIFAICAGSEGSVAVPSALMAFSPGVVPARSATTRFRASAPSRSVSAVSLRAQPESPR
jgi:hypothetical protein